MPRRTRSHELESESFRKFESYIPSRWVFRRKVPDYGIDGEIEIFDDNGISKGISINVQLKSTDASDIKRCLKETFKVETLKYYTSLAYPVLIAKYSKKFNKIFYSWAHSKNRPPIKEGQKQITVKLPEENILNTNTFFRLKSDVINFLNYRKKKLKPPFKLQLFVNNANFSKADLILQFKQYEKKHKVHIEACEQESEDAIGKIVITSLHVIISIGGDSASFKFGLPDIHDMHAKLLANLNIALAILLSHEGYDILSAELASPIYKQSTFFNQPRMIVGLLRCFYDAKAFDLVYDASKWVIVDSAFNKNNLNDIMFFSVYLYKNHDKSSLEEQTLVERLYLLLNNYFSEKNDRLRLATSHYNLGNFYKSKSEYLKALHHYNKARKVNVLYAKKNYYWAELGVILYNAGKKSCASQAYRRALEIKEQEDVRAKYADTLLYLGKYVDAVEEYEKFITSATEKYSPFWYLKLRTLKNIIAQFKIENGKRDVDGSNNIIQQALFERHEKVSEEDCEKAIHLDPLNAFPWFELGHVYLQEKNFEKASTAFLWTALCTDQNFEAWAYAFIIPLSTAPRNIDRACLTGSIFEAAYERNGANFISYMFDFIASRLEMDKDKREVLKALILRMAEDLSRKQDFTLRLVDKDMEVSEIEF